MKKELLKRVLIGVSFIYFQTSILTFAADNNAINGASVNVINLENKNHLVSYDVFTGEEIIHDFQFTEADISLNGRLVAGSVANGEETFAEEVVKEKSGFPYFTPNEPYAVANSYEYPWSVNVLVKSCWGGSCYGCSGTLIDPKHVITAGHCVYNTQRGGWASTVRVFPAFKEGDIAGQNPCAEKDYCPYGNANSLNHAAWEQFTDNNCTGSGCTQFCASHDVGLIYLDRPVGALTGWHGYGCDHDPDFYGFNTFNNPGYPVKEPPEYPYDGKTMCNWSGYFDQVVKAEPAEVFYVGVEDVSFHGQSGSGAYTFILDHRYIYAVLSCGFENASINTLFSPITCYKFYDIQAFIEEHTPSIPDLMPLNVKTSATEICAGKQLPSMSYVLHNYSSVNYNGQVNVDIYLSVDEEISSTDILLGSHSISGNIGPKGTAYLDLEIPPAIPADTPEGDYYLGVILNIADYNPGNNDSDGQDASQIHIINSNEDNDLDGVGDVCDNCPNTPNGPEAGTCTTGAMWQACMSNAECGINGVCSMNQEDANDDGVGDACDCNNPSGLVWKPVPFAPGPVNSSYPANSEEILRKFWTGQFLYFYFPSQDSQTYQQTGKCVYYGGGNYHWVEGKFNENGEPICFSKTRHLNWDFWDNDDYLSELVTLPFRQFLDMDMYGFDVLSGSHQKTHCEWEYHELCPPPIPVSNNGVGNQQKPCNPYHGPIYDNSCELVEYPNDIPPSGQFDSADFYQSLYYASDDTERYELLFEICDLDFDGDCDNEDYVASIESAGKCLGDIGYNPLVDMDIDGCVDESDVDGLFQVDSDNDGILELDDICPNQYNPDQSEAYPPQGNTCGDACECEGNFDGDADQDGTDAFTFKQDFGRSIINNPCTGIAACNGDFTCDGDCDGSDAFTFKSDFGRSGINNPCPNCLTVPWCMYQ